MDKKILVGSTKDLNPEKKSIYDQAGVLYDYLDNVISTPPFAVDSEHFWCVVCKEIKPLAEGVIANIQICGWTCLSHGK